MEKSGQPTDPGVSGVSFDFTSRTFEAMHAFIKDRMQLIDLYRLACESLLQSYEVGEDLAIPSSPIGKYVVVTTRLDPEIFTRIDAMAKDIGAQTGRVIAGACLSFIKKEVVIIDPSALATPRRRYRLRAKKKAAD